jgi:hypothetical protein
MHAVNLRVLDMKLHRIIYALSNCSLSGGIHESFSAHVNASTDSPFVTVIFYCCLLITYFTIESQAFT